MIHTEYYKDGTPCECEEMKRYNCAIGGATWEMPYVNGKKNGVYKEYYESGALKWESSYVNDKRHGMQKRYYESGALCDEFLWIDGCCVCLHCSAENFL
jgi:hypothetical protein